MAFVAFLIGAIFGFMLITGLVSLITRRFWKGSQYRWGTVAIAFLLAVVLYAIGSADGEPIRWTAGILPYGIAALIVGFGWQRLAQQKSLEA